MEYHSERRIKWPWPTSRGRTSTAGRFGSTCQPEQQQPEGDTHARAGGGGGTSARAGEETLSGVALGAEGARVPTRFLRAHRSTSCEMRWGDSPCTALRRAEADERTLPEAQGRRAHPAEQAVPGTSAAAGPAYARHGTHRLRASTFPQIPQSNCLAVEAAPATRLPRRHHLPPVLLRGRLLRPQGHRSSPSASTKWAAQYTPAAPTWPATSPTTCTKQGRASSWSHGGAKLRVQ